MLRAYSLTLEIKEFRCYEAKIEESEKAGSPWESNPGHLAQWQSTFISAYLVCRARPTVLFLEGDGLRGLSLVPRRGGGGERAPGTHCLRMRVIIGKTTW